MKDIYFLILDMLRQMWRFRWWSAMVMWLIGLIGALAVMSLPNVYEARAQFYVDADSRLREVVGKIGMNSSVSSRLLLVQQAMLGRPSIESVARHTGLARDGIPDAEFEAIIAEMMEELVLDTGRGHDGRNLFTLKYRHGDRQEAVAVIDKLMNDFQDQLISKKAAGTRLASEFLEGQLEHYRGLLTQTEAALQNFKRNNPGFVVDDTGGTFERLQRQRTEEERLKRLVKIQRDKRDELRRQLSRVDPYGASGNNNNGEVNSLIPGAQTRASITRLEAQRANLLLSFTENHPDITAIEQQLEILRAQLERELKSDVANRNVDGASRATNPVYIQIQLNLSAANLELAEVESQLKGVQGNIAELDERLNSAPEIERQFIALTRDYDKYQGLYEEVLLQTERERIGRVGEEQDVVTFNVIEPPHAGLEPVSPPRLVLLIGVFGIALGTAIALAFLMDQLKPTFGTEASLAKLNVPVLGSVAMFVTPETQSRRRSDLLRFLFVTAAFVMVYGVLFVGMDWGVAQLEQLTR